MPLLAILQADAFTALPDETVLGKDSYIKDEKENVYKLALNGEEAGKLALPLQQELSKVKENNARLLDEKIKTAAKVTAYEILGKTPEEIDSILKSGKTETIEELEKKYQAKEESLKTATQAEILSKQAEMDAANARTSEVQKELVQHMKRTAVAEGKSKGDMNKLGNDYLSTRVVVVQDDAGKYVTRVLDEQGEIAYKAGTFMTVDQLVEDAKADKELSGMFNGGIAGGSGGQNNQGGIQRPGTILANDQAGLSMNLEDIASGKVKVAG